MKTLEVIPWNDTKYPWVIVRRDRNSSVGICVNRGYKTEEEAKAAKKRMEEKAAEKAAKRVSLKARCKELEDALKEIRELSVETDYEDGLDKIISIIDKALKEEP